MIAPKHIALLLTGFSLTAQAAESAPKKVAPAQPALPDIKFLEYLGTLEGDDENWTDVDAPDEKSSAIVATEPQSKANAKVEPAKPVVERK